ncbi:MAG: DNA replication and repair protein RecF [Flavisolibacter sp.]
MIILSLFLSSLSLFQFKNYSNREFQFNSRIVGVCGRNGVGKTNILDAIYYLCFTKSYFLRQDQLNIQQGHEGFRLEGYFKLNGQRETAVCILRENGRKEFTLNSVAYSRFSNHIGHFPCVIIAPDDIQLIIGISEEKRKFIDTLLAQLDDHYLKYLINYTRLLQQRNSFLRVAEGGYGKDLSLLDVLDEQLAEQGSQIYNRRSQFLLVFLPLVKQYYIEICEKYEDINLYYETELLSYTFPELLERNRPKDLLLQRTSGGIHRDDLVLKFGNNPFKHMASQGQRKSLLFALKLAEMEMIKKEKKISPLLLLDDVFEKLDAQRTNNLLTRVCADADTQIFITDTSCKRLELQLGMIGQSMEVIDI